MKTKIFGILILSLFCLSMVSAWGPHTHNALSSSIFNSQNDIGKLCSESELNKAAYLLGAQVPDMTVIYYYAEGGKEYRISHNWNFQQEVMAQALTDDEICLAYGIASHLVADGISHNEAVPEGILASKIPNWLAHPLLEKKYDSYLIIKNRELLETTPHMMDALYGENGDRYVEMIDKAMGTNSKIVVKDELVKLSYALGTFYDGQFVPQGQKWIFKVYPAIDKFTNFLAPVIGSTNSAAMDEYYEKSKEATLNTFNNWGARYKISAHGFDNLSKANEGIGFYTIFILILIFAAPIAFVIFAKRSKWWLLLIPGLIVVGVVVAYMLL